MLKNNINYKKYKKKEQKDSRKEEIEKFVKRKYKNGKR